MKTVCKKLLSLMLVAMLLVSAVPFQVFATEGEADPTETTAAATEAVVETTAATEAPAAVAEASAETTAATEAAEPAAETTTEATEATTEATQATTEATEATTEATEATTEATEATTEATEATTVETTPTVTKPVQTTIPGQINIFANPMSESYAAFFHPVVVGKSYGHISSLPTPTRTHYTFLGWYVTVNNVEYRVDDSTQVGYVGTGSEPLIAKWALNQYTVTFERYTGSAWEAVESHKVSALGVMTTANGFPTDSEISSKYALSGYTIVGWEIGETDVAFNVNTSAVGSNLTVRPRYQRTITLLANNPNDYTSNSSKTVTVEIGEPVPALPNPGARDGYTFVDWVAADQSTVISTKANLSKVNVHPKYYPSLGTTFHARWTPSTVVYLYIHTNGNTQTATKVVPYYEAPTSGAFDTSLINMYSIFSGYGDYDDNDDAAYGWYDATQWKNYCANTAANAATVFYDIAKNDYIELHIMLINGGGANTSNNNYNNNVNTADPSNPTTGDYIFMAVTVLAISGAALAVIFFMKKRKASK